MKLIPILVLFFLTNNVYANLFGPSNYEECMNDGKVGRNLSEIQLKNKECRKKFPVLPSIKGKKTNAIDCHLSNDVNFVFMVKLESGAKKAIAGEQNADVISFTDEVVLLRWYSNNKEVNMRINYIMGNFSLQGGGGSDTYGKCSEIR